MLSSVHLFFFNLEGEEDEELGGAGGSSVGVSKPSKYTSLYIDHRETAMDREVRSCPVLQITLLKYLFIRGIYRKSRF